jgi:bifunctional non-homologous end joining protein LigD
MITHPEKVLFPDDGITKGDLAAYYETVAPQMIPHMRGRPVTMERYPAGIGKPGFMQKNVEKGFPDWLQRASAPKKNGTVNYPLVNDERSLLWLANQNCITPHVWTSRMPDLYQPDVCVFDLDPSEDDPAVLRAAALSVRDLLAEIDLQSWVKTSGSKGYHIIVPLRSGTDFDEVSRFAYAAARVLIARDPEHLTLEFSKADRGPRIYIDIGRNGYGATFAAAYAVRPKRGAPVSAPCTWQEIERGEAAPQAFTLRNVPERIARVGDLWAGMRGRALRRPLERLQRLLAVSASDTAPKLGRAVAVRNRAT